MASHKIRISLATSAAGIPPDDTGIVGLIAQGVAVAGKLVLDTCYALKKRADLATYGITAAYDLANGTAIFQQLTEFYDQAGDGAQIWLQVCAKNTAFATYFQSVAFDTFVRQTAANDSGKQAKIIGTCYAPPTVRSASAGDFPTDVTDSITQAQIRQADHFTKGFCYGVIVDGYNMTQGKTAVTLITQANNTAQSVSLCITGSKANGVSAVGAALGRYARISVGRGVGAVEDGALSVTSAYLTNGVAFFAGGAALTVGDNYLVIGAPIVYNGVTYQPGAIFLAVAGFTVFTLATAGNGGYLSNGVTPITPVGDPANGGTPGMISDDLDTLGDKQFFFLTTVQGIQGLYWNDGATCTATTNFFSSMEYMRVACLLAYDARVMFTGYRGQTLPQDRATGALEPTWCDLKEMTFTKQYITPLNFASGTGDITDAAIIITGPTYGLDAQLDFNLQFIRSTILGNVIGTIGQSLTL